MYVVDYVGPARGHTVCQIAPETLSECPKFQYFPEGACPQTPLVGALRAHTTVGLTTTKLLAPALYYISHMSGKKATIASKLAIDNRIWPC